jgi:hypothetical protein
MDYCRASVRPTAGSVPAGPNPISRPAGVASRAVLVTKVVVIVLTLEMLKFVAMVVALEVPTLIVLTAVAAVVRECCTIHRKSQHCSKD